MTVSHSEVTFSKSGEGRKSVLMASSYGVCAAALVFAWLFLGTHYLYGGNWTSVYYTGEHWATPPQLAHENIYRFPGTAGYDGEQYHVVAHDPLARSDMWKTVDMPRFRYRRILLPGFAALLSFGRDSWVDPAYIAAFLLFVYLGTFWLTRWVQSHGFAAAWGLLFLLVPATLACVLFMVVDVATAALTVGLVWYSENRRDKKLYLVLLAAGLSRETGLILPLGYCCWLLWNKQLKRAVVFGTSMIPAVLWFLWVQWRFPAKGFEYVTSPIPFIGIYRGIMAHYVYRQHVLLYLDFLAIGAMAAAIVLAGYFAIHRKSWSAATFVGLGFAAVAALISHELVWAEVNAFGRHFAPLLITVGMTAAIERKFWFLMPIGLIDLRILVVYADHAHKILAAALHPR
jgi:hypothetical protein